jgi:hypothetical protein
VTSHSVPCYNNHSATAAVLCLVNQDQGAPLSCSSSQVNKCVSSVLALAAYRTVDEPKLL